MKNTVLIFENILSIKYKFVEFIDDCHSYMTGIQIMFGSYFTMDNCNILLKPYKNILELNLLLISISIHQCMRVWIFDTSPMNFIHLPPVKIEKIRQCCTQFSDLTH